MEIFKQTNFDFLGKKWPFIAFSLLLTLAGLVSLMVKHGPKYGIDFNGGALMNVNFVQRPSADKIRTAVHSRIKGEIEVQEITNTQQVLISTSARNDAGLQAVRNDMLGALNSAFNPNAGSKLDLNQATQESLAGALRDPLQQAGVALSGEQVQQLAGRILHYRDTPPRSGLIRNIAELSSIGGVTPKVIGVLRSSAFLGQFHIGGVEVVGPKIGKDLRQQAINVVLIALAAMLVYIAFRFEWIYGVAAVIAVFHDTIITIGLFSLFNKQIDLTVIAALLTLVGYSMNDTIVVFDRIRENLRLNMRGSFSDIVNASINQTLSRTILTSGLTFLTALSLWIFGGQVLNGFSFALVIGIIVGTYSSVFIASPILIFWQNLAEGRRKGSSPPSRAPRAPVAAGTPKAVGKGMKTAK